MAFEGIVTGFVQNRRQETTQVLYSSYLYRLSFGKNNSACPNCIFKNNLTITPTSIKQIVGIDLATPILLPRVKISS
jgi:hypothetical protein